jgi:GT2 family glycosyltransferase
VLSLDDDVELAPDALTLLVEAMQHPRVGVVGARIVYDDAPDQVASAAGYLNRWLGTYRGLVPTTRMPCDFVSSCGCLIRRAALDAVGGFDRDYFTSHGDVDLCLRIQGHGYEIVYAPAAVIRHKVARNGTRTPERVYYLYRNKLLLLRKHLPWWRRPAVFALYATLWLPRVLVGSLAHHHGLHRPELRAILLAVLDAIRDRRGEARWFGRHTDG